MSFYITPDIRDRARFATDRGERITFTPVEILELIDMADLALNSGPAEELALRLYVRETLAEAFQDPARRRVR